MEPWWGVEQGALRAAVREVRVAGPEQRRWEETVSVGTLELVPLGCAGGLLGVGGERQ